MAGAGLGAALFAGRIPLAAQLAGRARQRRDRAQHRALAILAVDDAAVGLGDLHLAREEQERPEAALVPLSAMADGHAVIEVNPVSPTRVYHLVCEDHVTLKAAGLEVESFHPGPETPISLPEEKMRLFMSFFPHLTDLRDFGRLAAPRISAEEFHAIR